MNKFEQLQNSLRALESVVVAYSGGVDSTFLLKVAHDVLDASALAITADSPSLPREDLREAQAIAKQIGARHLCIPISEMSDARYVDNPPDRCYICKTHTYDALVALAEREGFRVVVDGNNADDAHDVRPGRRAAQERGVRSPLQEVGLTKAEIRQLAREHGLPNWDKPAAACLSSRIPYGTRITVEALSQVERAENYLRALGVGQARVRHLNTAARIEVAPEAFPLVRENRTAIVAYLNALGFREVLLNLDGYRMGSLNTQTSPRVEVL
ncbi:MAG: ATP-dependent sacrificial sulfur transferase LarE [Chloroflexota bacterium]